MNSEIKTARIVGVLFIIATVVSSLTMVLLGFLEAPDYLVAVSANEITVLTGVLLELFWAFSVIGIPVYLFPILKKHNENLALGFFSFRFVEAIGVIIGSIGLLSLLTLGQEFVLAGAPLASSYQILGTLLLATRNWAFMIGSGLAWSLSAVILNYLLYNSKLIPQWLSVFGLVGGILSLGTYLLQFFSIHLEILFIVIAVQEMVFAVWLIVKGFNLSSIVSNSAKTDME